MEFAVASIFVDMGGSKKKYVFRVIPYINGRGMVLRFIIDRCNGFRTTLVVYLLKRLKVMTQTASGIGGGMKMARVISTINHISGQ